MVFARRVFARREGRLVGLDLPVFAGEVVVVGLRDRGRGLVKSKRERSVAARIGSNLEISSGQCGCQPVEGEQGK